MREKFQALVIEVFGIIKYTKLLLTHSASYFVQEICVKLKLLQFNHPNHV